MTLVVILTVRPAFLEQFRAFERQAAGIMARYGGAIERTVVVPPAAAGALLQEIHLVTFPGPPAFDAYRQDPDLARLAPLRETAIVGTQILIGEEGPAYGNTN